MKNRDVYGVAASFMLSASVAAGHIDTAQCETGSRDEVDATIIVKMQKGNASTFYVDAKIGNLSRPMMVDTGSAYMTVNESTASALGVGPHSYVKDLHGILADGSELTIPVHRISEIEIGEKCTLYNIEAAVFKGQNTREILGNTVLNHADSISLKNGTITFSDDICNKLPEAQEEPKVVEVAPSV